LCRQSFHQVSLSRGGWSSFYTGAISNFLQLSLH
jgi:hypothetical protein